MARPRFPMGGMGANANNMIKQAQKMQQEMLKAQEEMENSDFEATSGGGAVLVRMNGKKELTEIIIKPEVCDSDDVEMLQDLVLSAVNEAMKKVDNANNEKMSRLTGGLNIPGLF